MNIHLDGIHRIFEGAAAVNGVTLDIGSGKLVALLGPSGSGKTTILRMVAGLDFPDKGSIRFGEEDATNIPVAKRGVGFVFQHYALFPHMTLAENIAFGMEALKPRRSKAEIAARVEELLGLVRLPGLGRRFPAQISGGQRQRVALARALAVEPRVLLLDEPFGALDAAVRRDLRRWLREIHDDLGITTIFVTHDQEEALDLADEVVILSEGRIVQSGTPREVTRRPGSAFVLNFLGDANRLPVEIRGGGAFLGPLNLAAPGLADGPAALYARPRDIAWSGPLDPNGLPARIERILDRPDSRRLVVLAATGETVELDATPDDESRPGDAGSIRLHRWQIFKD
ncbi:MULTISPECIES: sulfate/molybdate ABC transporter ATP-binding protein [unclassified Aureimonas]|uniref:sulfate/molybdate ABC transporter ATP-binding protein n=1 Tax=unclassified Aureimonas TaxID=2615206 RepID=UPI0006FA40E2|nr:MULTISPECIES: sulfate/molybdate ABC transporter ATP-binding protein [unclassified Aureimonas]KQT53930.1 sulfate ABC transporter ATP-binding protein [Aureimonas sp. Leaf427]KQT71630.1 sulfate ABC transporter ATP-binding protein [Aureimonas sp. Leaf460]